MIAPATGPAALHIPVMVEEVVDRLITDPDGLYVDGTAGMGGHTRALAGRLSPRGQVLGLELDPQAFALLDPADEAYGGRAVFRQGSYADMARHLKELGVTHCQGILLDLGLSSYTLEHTGRGFSYRSDEPLDMRFDPGSRRPLAEVLPGLSAAAIADILYQYGEERRSRAIAAAIHRAVNADTVATSGALADVVRTVVKGPHATKSLSRVFQAFRIFINDELETLKTFMVRLPGLLNIGGRAAIIAFHSLEDRIVKQFIAAESRDCICPPERPICDCGHKATVKPVHRKPLVPSAEERDRNPRSRSAKLRIMERIA